jgi:rubredoxin
MAAWTCELCSYVYDEEKEAIKWADLPDDWVCPICGSPKSAFVPLEPSSASAAVPPAPPELPAEESYQCTLCSYIYDEAKEGVAWADLPDDWTCPVCGSGKASFVSMAAAPPAPAAAASTAPDGVDADYLAEWRRPADEFEGVMADIHRVAETGRSVIEPMRTRLPSFSWDEILVRGAQLSKLPLNKSQPVTTRTVIGPAAAVPMVLETPLLVSHMSFGALSREAKLALAKGSAQAGAGMCSGEGGVLPECLAAAHQ